MEGDRPRRWTDDYLPSQIHYLDTPEALNQYGNFPCLPGTNLPLWNEYFQMPPSDESEAIRTRRYIAVVLVPHATSSSKRARFAYDDATLRWQLPEVTPRSTDHACAICLQDLVVDPGSSASPEEEEEEEEATPRAMPCSHAFHERCIFKWVRLNRTCPVCRRSLPMPHELEYNYHDDDRLQLTVPVPREMLQIEVL